MKRKLLIALSLLFILLFHHYSSAQILEKKRPKEMWVFRSVLDKRPRVVTLALNNDLWAAYDAKNCCIIKTWKGEVEMVGSVYNYSHGPQPKSVGKTYSEGIVDDTVWHVLKDGKQIHADVNFKGYSWKNNEIIFKYELITDDGKKISIQENPDFIRKQKSNLPGIQRIFTIQGVQSGYEVVLDVKIESLPKKDDFETNGIFIPQIKAEYYYDWGKTIMMKGKLKLNSNSSTYLITYFSPKVVQ